MSKQADELEEILHTNLNLRDKFLYNLLNKNIVVFSNFFYQGTLKAYDNSFLELEDVSIIYETGEIASHDKWVKVETLAKTWLINRDQIESLGLNPKSNLN